MSHLAGRMPPEGIKKPKHLPPPPPPQKSLTIPIKFDETVLKQLDAMIEKRLVITPKTDENGIQVLPKTSERIESGPLQFGDDWPGVFIRGDSAGWYAMNLKMVIERLERKDYEDIDVMMIHQLKQLKNELSGCIIGPAKEIVDGR